MPVRHSDALLAAARLYGGGSSADMSKNFDLLIEYISQQTEKTGPDDPEETK